MKKSVKERKKTPGKTDKKALLQENENKTNPTTVGKTVIQINQASKRPATSKPITYSELSKRKPIPAKERPKPIIKSLLPPKELKPRKIIEKEEPPITLSLSSNIILQQIKSLKVHERGVLVLLLLKDGRIASCANDALIKIINPQKNYKVDLELIGHKGAITYICQLDNGQLVTSSLDYALIFWELIEGNQYRIVATIKKAHYDLVWKVIALTKNRIASCAEDRLIKIWSCLEPFTLMHTFEGHTMSVRSVIQLRGREKIVSGGNDGAIRVWNTETYQAETSLEEVYCRNNHCLLELYDGIIMVAGFNIITFLDLNRVVIIKSLINVEFGQLFSLIELSKDILLFVGENLKFILYNRETETIESIQSTHTEPIRGLMNSKDNSFLSCSTDKTIRVWEYTLPE